MPMSFCVGCGNELMEDWRACPSCGVMKPETKDKEKSENVSNNKQEDINKGSKTGEFAVKYLGFSKRHHTFAIKEPGRVTKISIGPTGILAKLSAVKFDGKVISKVTGNAGIGTFHAKWSSNFSLPSGRKYSIKFENSKFATKGITLLTSASLTNSDGVTKKAI